MLNSYAITIKTERGVREIFVSPLLLQSKYHSIILKSHEIETWHTNIA
jgi:hypothetical protein